MTLSPSDLRPRRVALVIAVAGIGLGAGSSSAWAQAGGCQGPPGASAVEQYCEAIPRADGGRTKAGGDSSGSTLSDKTAGVLTSSGSDGAAVKRLSDDGSAPATDKKTSSAKSAGAGSGDASGTSPTGSSPESVVGPVDASGSPLEAATSAVENGPTAGPALAWGVVGMSAFGAAAALLIRRRNMAIPPARGADTPGSGPGGGAGPGSGSDGDA